MDVVYIPQLEDVSFAGSGRYRIVRAIPDDGRVGLRDRCVTRIEVATSAPLTLVFPPAVSGAARDFFVRLVVTADAPPEITFAPPSGEFLSFEDANENALMCEVGVNVFAFTETDAGIFIVNRKVIDIEQTVEFDPCGGTLDGSSVKFKLGARFTSMPVPVRDGYSFVGWYTAAEEGERIAESDIVKTSITRLYARWEVYVDPFAPHIAPSGGLEFFTEGDVGWFVDSDYPHSGSGCARSGAIGDTQESVIKTTVNGAGTLSFFWRADSEDYYDMLRLIVDGEEVANIGGWRDWEEFSWNVSAPGSHEIVWRYSKDSSGSQGADCGWIDDVVWTPEGGA
jgi:uncharacterized repeat protein (TIGR02543 family)